MIGRIPMWRAVRVRMSRRSPEHWLDRHERELEEHQDRLGQQLAGAGERRAPVKLETASSQKR